MKPKKLRRSLLHETEMPPVTDVTPEKKEPVSFDIDELDMAFGEEGEDISVNKRKTGLRSVFTLSNLMLAVCLVTLAVCCVILIGRLFDYKRTDDIYLTLSNDMFKEVSDDPSVISAADPYLPEANINNYDKTLHSGVSTGQLAPSTAVTDI